MRLVQVAGTSAGGIVLGWLLRVTVTLVVLGLVAYDAFSLTYTNVTTVDNANIVAAAGAQVLLESPDSLDRALAESREQAEQLGVRLRARDWWVDEEGVVHVTVSKGAPSVLLKHVTPMRRYLTIRAVGTA
jgi:hypothetical protein